MTRWGIVRATRCWWAWPNACASRWRRPDTLGRLGGDEFVVVMPHIAHMSDVERCAKRLVDRVSSTAQVGDLEVNLTASVGVCVYPDFAEDVDSLLERADAATYAAKENGRNQYQIFSETMLKESQDRLSMDMRARCVMRWCARRCTCTTSRSSR